MLKNNAFDLIQQYINGWKQNNIPMNISCLSENCIVIESHGTTYQGISDIKNWFKLWLHAKSEITKWDILSFYFCENEKTAFIEWDFSCISNAIKYNVSGISVIKFTNKKISFIHEYRMSHQAYIWGKDELKFGD